MNDSAPTVKSQRRRGIYLLPNLFTTAAMFAGFYAIVSATQDRFGDAALAIIVAGVLDGLDGRVARLTNTQTEFGIQYDSLSDLVSFGLAPALVVFLFSLQHLGDVGTSWGKLGWAVAFIYAACGALRLARFNTQAERADKRFFQGLASPAAAGLLASFIWTLDDLGIAGADVVWLALPLTLAAALLMVSNVRYLSFKGGRTSGGERVRFIWIAALVVIFALIAIDPPKTLLAIGVIYALTGIIITLRGRARWQRLRRERARRNAERQADG